MRNLEGIAEALLFAYGESMTYERLAALLGVSSGEAEKVAKQLAASLEANESRGLALLYHGASVQLVTHPRHAETVSELLRGEMSQDLGPAALETLALVAYFGPVQRSVIDHVRGVSSALSLRTLMVRGMVERIREGKGEHQYQVTADLLRDMGVTDRADLPDFDELSQLLARSLSARDQAAEVRPSNELEQES